MTSEAMILNYWAEKQGVSFRTDPEKLNNYLKSIPNGYDDGVYIYHGAVAAYAVRNGIEIYYHGDVPGNDDAILDSYLRSGSPVVLGVNKTWNEENKKWYAGHYVTATGITTVNGEKTWSINDPLYGSTTLSEKYGNVYWGIKLFSGYPKDRMNLVISAHSPVQLLVTDALGRRAGYDIITGQTILEIPGADYSLESIIASDDPTINLEPAKYVTIPSPLDGGYQIQIIGIGNGEYLVNTAATAWDGDMIVQTITGVAIAGSIRTAEVTYDGALGIPIYIFLPMVHSK